MILEKVDIRIREYKKFKLEYSLLGLFLFLVGKWWRTDSFAGRVGGPKLYESFTNTFHSHIHMYMLF